MFISKEHPKKAMTLIELMVVLVIVALMIALILPAVVAAREAARRAECSSKFRQLGVAMLNYQSTTGCFPLFNNGKKGFSALAMILPQIDQNQLFNAVNFSNYYFDQSNMTSSRVVISVLLCPSDRNASGPKAWTNYACNSGYAFQITGSYNGIFVSATDPPVGPSDITDGLSSTALMSEWIRGTSSNAEHDPLGDIYQTKFGLSLPSQFEDFTEACQRLSPIPSSAFLSDKGKNWMNCSMGHTTYNHNSNPNSNTCLNDDSSALGCWSASSRHPQGANLLFADGHVAFMKQPQNVSLWRSIGTRSGNEIIDSY